MKNVFNIILSILFFISCKEPSKKEIIASEKTTKDAKEIVVEANPDSLSRKVVNDFYTWYINDVYFKGNYDYDHAPYKNYSGKFGLDIEVYKEKLNKVVFFSESFKEKLLEQNKKCNEAMLSADLKDFDPEYDADFYLGKNNTLCDFLWQSRWFGSQEGENKKFEVLDGFSKREGTYIYTVQTFIYDKPFTKYEVVIIKEGDFFKIASILLLGKTS